MENSSALHQIDNSALGCYHSIDNDYFHYSIHIHDCYELYYFISGDVTYYVEGTAYKLNPNDLLLINNKELHRPQLNSACVYERTVINFNKDLLNEFNFRDYNLFSCLDDRSPGENNLIPSYEVLSNNINILIQNIRNCKDKSLSSEILKKTYLVQLLISLNNIINDIRGDELILDKNNERIIQIIRYINDNIASDLSLSTLEDKFYITKYYLCHQFKASTGFTLNEYITYKRIMKARELIKSGAPLTEIHALVGFGDHSNFYKAFKKVTGFSPKQYKYNILNNK